MNLILLILGRLYNINISSYTKTIQIMQYYYAINRASRRRPPHAVIVTPRTFRPCSLHAPRINTSHSTSQFTTSHFRTSQFTHARLLTASWIAYWHKSNFTRSNPQKLQIQVATNVEYTKGPMRGWARHRCDFKFNKWNFNDIDLVISKQKSC